MRPEIVVVPQLAAWNERSNVPVSYVVRSGGFVFTAGIPPLDLETGSFVAGGIEAQTEQVMRNVGLCLEAAGTDFDHVVRTTVYVTNAAHFGTINQVYGRYFRSAAPARTFVVVGSWPVPIDLEIEVVAAMPTPA